MVNSYSESPKKISYVLTNYQSIDVILFSGKISNKNECIFRFVIVENSPELCKQTKVREVAWLTGKSGTSGSGNLGSNPD